MSCCPDLPRKSYYVVKQAISFIFIIVCPYRHLNLVAGIFYAIIEITYAENVN